jgi:hypothetical protein
MRKLLSIALCLPLAACVIGDEDPGSGGGGGDDQGPVDPNLPPADGSLVGLIMQDATWSGTVLIGFSQTTTRIEPGVTITVSPGTIIKFKPGASLDIKGTLRVQGTSAEKVQLQPALDNTYGLIVGGTLDLTYAVMTRGNIQTSVGSTTTITDSKMYRAAGDLLIMNGGSVTMTYSQLGRDATDLPETTHCLIHTSGNANTINITRSNINGAPFGLMLYGGQNAIFTNNNWYDNTERDIDTQPAVSADVSGGYFDGGTPNIGGGGGAMIKADNLSATKLTDAGVRP